MPFKKGRQLISSTLLVGVLAVVSAYAVIKSGGLSIMIFMPLTLLLLSFKLKRIEPIVTISREVLIAILSASLYFLLNYFQLFSFDGELIAMDRDYSFYARLSAYLRDFGIENWNIEYFLLEGIDGVLPYHYFDLWFTALISQAFDIHSQYALFLIVYPISFVIISLLIYRNLIRFKIKPLPAALICLCAPAFSLMGLLYPQSIAILKMDVWSGSLIETQKVTYAFIGFLLLLEALMDKHYLNFIVFTGLISIVYITYAPSLFVASCLFLIVLRIRRRLSYIYFLKMLALNTLMFSGTVVFYLLFGGNSSISISFKELIDQFTELSELRIMFNITIKAAIQTVIISLPFLMTLFMCRKRLNKQLQDLLIFCLLFYIAGLFAWVVLHNMHDSVQFWSMVQLLTSIILVITSVALIVQHRNMSLKIAAFLLLFGFGSFKIYQKFDQQSKLKDSIIVKSILIDKSPRVAYMKEGDEYNSIFSTLEQVYVGNVKTLLRLKDELRITCISNHIIPRVGENSYKYQENSTFIKFMEFQKSDETFISESESQRTFLERHKINYLMISKKRALPNHLKPLFVEERLGVIDGYSVFLRNDN